jgi:hypothetical protein
MGIMTECVKLSLPKGKAWQRIIGEGLILALGEIFEGVRTEIYKIIAESRPGTATDTLPEWHETLGQKYDSTRPIEEQRSRLEAIRLSVGGMTKFQLQEQIDKEFTGIVVSEVTVNSECGLDECGVSICGAVEGDYSTLYYDVIGDVLDDDQAFRVGAILAHYAPLHLQACMDLGIEGISTTSECGVGICGVEESGSTGI